MGRPVTCLMAILMFLPMASLAYTNTQMTSAGTAWFDCEDSWASIHDSEGNLIVNGSDFAVFLEEENHTFEIPEMDKCQGIIPVSEEMPNLRPSPTEAFPAIDSQICQQNGVSLACEGEYTTGDLINDSADVFALNVSDDTILALTLVAASASIEVTLHFQNETHEVELDQGFILPLNTSLEDSNVLYIPISEEGRIIVTISSPSPDTVWSIRSEIFDTNTVTPLSHLDEIMGVGKSSFSYPLGGDESLVITSSISNKEQMEIPVMYRYIYSENAQSEWETASIDTIVKGIDDVNYIEFMWDCDCQWYASMSLHRHFDAGWGMDAPGLRPMTSTSDNSTYPLIVMDGHREDGELTLFMGDYQDILRVETTGWNESIHLVEVIVEGDIYDLEVTIWDIDQNTWDSLEEITKTYSMNEISASLEVGRGTHFIRIQHVNGSDSVGDFEEPVEWKIRVTTAVLDEGEEPWFPPSEQVKDAADIFYWLIGLILILPFIVFYLMVRNEKQFALDFASRKDRLEWLSKKLSDGEYQSKDLVRALRAVSSLEWEDSLELWGEPRARHLTMGIDMAVWSLDHVPVEGSDWPILIGIQSKEVEWNIAALKFEAPEGEPWLVNSVEPKLLSRDHEIFLDTINSNSRLFVQVTLSGGSDSLDIHLSGIVDGEPMAAKVPKTIYRNDPTSIPVNSADDISQSEE